MHLDKRRGKQVKPARATVRKSVKNLDLFGKFKEIIPSEGRAESTLGQYDKNYGYFIEFLNQSNILHSIDVITKDKIREYIVFMRDDWIKFDGHHFKPKEYQTPVLSPVTTNTRLKTLRTCLNVYRRRA